MRCCSICARQQASSSSTPSPICGRRPLDPWWATWFELAGLPAFPSARGGVHFNSQLIEGAAAILTPEFWAATIAAGSAAQRRRGGTTKKTDRSGSEKSG